MHLMPNSWHYISGQFSIQAPRNPQKSAISLPQAPAKLFKSSLTPDEINKRIEQGFQFIAVSIDTALLQSAAKGLVGQIKR